MFNQQQRRFWPFRFLGLVKTMVVVALIVFGHGVIANGAEPSAANHALRPEQKILNAYIQREAHYDPTVANLYADKALIQVKRVLPTGDHWTEYIPALHYKAMLRQLMPLAKVSGDASDYTIVKQSSAKKGRVRFKLKRHDRLGHYEAPVELVVGPHPNQPNDWLIYEEYSEIKTSLSLQ